MAEQELDHTGWPVREEGWEERLIERTRALFAGLAERTGLAVEWDTDAPVELACTFREQEGLEFDLHLVLQNSDELWLWGEWFSACRFPADLERTWQDFARLAEGMLTGEARALIHHCGDRAKAYRTEAQVPENGGWRTMSTGFRLSGWRPWGRRTEVVQNRSGQGYRGG